MRTRNYYFAITVLLIFTSFRPISGNAQTPVPHSSHVVLIIEENTSFDTASVEMPWLVSQGKANGYAANYSSNTAGSLMDYSGSRPAAAMTHLTALCRSALITFNAQATAAPRQSLMTIFFVR